MASLQSNLSTHDTDQAIASWDQYEREKMRGEDAVADYFPLSFNLRIEQPVSTGS